MTDTRSYPPSPWRLRATGHFSLWRMPARDLHLLLPEGVRPLIFARSAWLTTGFVTYEPGGDLSYRELFMAVLVRVEGGLALHVRAIWVDSETSLQGGRALWGVPKQAAQFRTAQRDAGEIECFTSQGVLAHSGFRARWRWPFGLTARALVVQENNGALQYTPVAVSATVTFGVAHWQLMNAGPLQALRGRKPILSASMRNAHVRFGA